MSCSNDTFRNGTGPLYSLHVSGPLTILVVLLFLLTVFGNVLVVIAVLTSRALKAPQNLFLVSLASADILVATLVMPFSLANELMGYWYFGMVWCEIHLALDVFFCTASITQLCAISLDRYWSITQAIQYNLKRTPRRIKCIILIVWIIAAVISFPPLITMKKEHECECKINDDTWYIIYSCSGSFFVPCIIMILVYIRIYQIAKKRTRTPPGDGKRGVRDQKQNGLDVRQKPEDEDQKGELNGEDLEESSSSDHEANSRGPNAQKVMGNNKLSRIKPGDHIPRIEEHSRSKGSRWKGRQNREKRFTFVLAVVMGVFVLCWFPFFFSYTLMAIWKSIHVPEPLFKFFFWCGYCNSSLNPIIYTIFNNDFRKAFKKILCRSDRKRMI